MKIKDILTINNSKNLMVINAKMDTIRFCTERLTIRQFCEKDADSYFRLLSHPRVHCFADEKLESIEEAKDQILKKKDRNDGSEPSGLLKTEALESFSYRMSLCDIFDRLNHQKN